MNIRVEDNLTDLGFEEEVKTRTGYINKGEMFICVVEGTTVTIFDEGFDRIPDDSKSFVGKNNKTFYCILGFPQKI